MVACREYVVEQHTEGALAGKLVCQLSHEAFVELVRSEALYMEDIELFEGVRRGKAGKKQSKAALKERVAPLMEHVRFGLMPGRELRTRSCPPSSSTPRSRWTPSPHNSQRKEVHGHPAPPPLVSRAKGDPAALPGAGQRGGYRIAAAAERSGLFWHLGSVGGAQVCARPTSVTASWSTQEHGVAASIVGPDGHGDGQYIQRRRRGLVVSGGRRPWTPDVAQPVRMARQRFQRTAKLESGGAAPRV